MRRTPLAPVLLVAVLVMPTQLEPPRVWSLPTNWTPSGGRPAQSERLEAQPAGTPGVR